MSIPASTALRRPLTMLIVLVMMTWGCGGERGTGEQDGAKDGAKDGTMDAAAAGQLDDQVRKDLATVAAHRVFFGHHSVGQDILDGVAVLAREAGIKVEIGEGPVGQNQDPLSKIRDFEKEARARDVELAVMKLCYVDFSPTTDVASLVRAYRDAVQRLRADKPGLKILHVTAPLTAEETDLKSRANRALGRQVWGDQSNVRRLEYADALKAAYPHEAIFDVALVESSPPAGPREIRVVGDRQVPMLWPGFSRDGGHLNDAGKRAVAKAFLRALAGALES